MLRTLMGFITQTIWLIPNRLCRTDACIRLRHPRFARLGPERHSTLTGSGSRQAAARNFSRTLRRHGAPHIEQHFDRHPTNQPELTIVNPCRNGRSGAKSLT